MTLDLARNFNDSVAKRKLIKMLSVQTAVDSRVKVDLTTGLFFSALPLEPRPSTSNLFNFEFEGRFYRFDSCPFGLSSARPPHRLAVATLAVSSVLHDATWAAVRAVLRYLDDCFLIIGRTRGAAAGRFDVSRAASVLSSFGLTLCQSC